MREMISLILQVRELFHLWFQHNFAWNMGGSYHWN